MFKHKKIKYNPDTPSVGVPIIAHANEVILPVPVAKRIYKRLKDNDPFTPGIYKKLKYLFSHTVVKS
jgi:hypothetical protein